MLMYRNLLNCQKSFKRMVFMEKKQKSIGIIALFITVSLAVIIIAVGLVVRTKRENPETWVLHSYGNNVALYNGDEVVEVYGSIVLDTLPDEDRRLLDNGIHFTTKEEAVSAIEDYDG